MEFYELLKLLSDPDKKDFHNLLEQDSEAEFQQTQAFSKEEMVEAHESRRMNTLTLAKQGIKTSYHKNDESVQKTPKLKMEDISLYSLVVVEDLTVGTTHRSQVIRGKIIVLPNFIDAGVHTIVQDLNGDCLQVSIYNLSNIQDIFEAEKVFKIGNELSIYDPHMKIFTSGGAGIQIDDPSEIYIGPPRPDFLQIDHKQEGNRCFKNQHFKQALKFYTLGLKKNQQTAKILGNISACLLNQQKFFHALLYAYTSVRVDEFYAKGWFRISECLKELCRTDELWSAFKFAPEEMQNAFNTVQFQENVNLPKNKCKAMRSLFASKISSFVETQETQIDDSLENLKSQGNEFFRQKEFKQALNFYLNALDQEKSNISTLLNNRSACYLKLNDFLNSVIDASASFLIKQQNNEKAIFRRASALREMGDFYLAQKSIKSETQILNQSAPLQKFLTELESLNKQNLSKVENNYRSKSTQEDFLERKNQFEMAQCLKQLRNFTLGDLYDVRIPNFAEEYIQEGCFPSQCDLKLCKAWLQIAHQGSIVMTKELDMFPHYQSEPQDFEIVRRLGVFSKKRISWWKNAKLGDVNFIDRPGNYSHELLHNFSNVWPHPLDLEYGTVHVAVGYVDLGQLLAANYLKSKNFKSEKENQVQNCPPLRFVGYEQSVYCTAKTLVIAEMLKQKLNPKIILQVWYSSGWSLETLRKFRLAIDKIIQEQNLDCEVKKLLKHWLAAPQTSLLETQKLWLKYHPEHGYLPANITNKRDRIEFVSYLLTGRLLECDVGSTVMFGNPAEYFHVSYDEKVTWLLREDQIFQNYEQYGSTIIATFVGITLKRIQSLSEKISHEKIYIDLRLGRVSPEDKKMCREIQSLCPRTMSWSNLVDYFGVQKFHYVAKLCSIPDGGTVHFAQSMNWIQDVKGVQAIDYPFKWQKKQHNKVCKENFQVQKSRGYQEIFSLPPVDHPWNLIDGFLMEKYVQKWADKFYEIAGVSSEHVFETVSYPYSLLCRSQGNLYMKYVYDYLDQSFTDES